MTSLWQCEVPFSGWSFYILNTWLVVLSCFQLKMGSQAVNRSTVRVRAEPEKPSTEQNCFQCAAMSSSSSIYTGSKLLHCETGIGKEEQASYLWIVFIQIQADCTGKAQNLIYLGNEYKLNGEIVKEGMLEGVEFEGWSFGRVGVIWSGHSRWLFSCSVSIPCSRRACFTSPYSQGWPYHILAPDPS